MIRTQIYLPENQIAQLKQLAYQEDVSLSEIIRKTIDEKITKTKKTGKTKKPKTKYKNVREWFLSMAREAERKKWRGPKDLASNVDKYLYGKK